MRSNRMVIVVLVVVILAIILWWALDHVLFPDLPLPKGAPAITK